MLVARMNCRYKHYTVNTMSTCLACSPSEFLSILYTHAHLHIPRTYQPWKVEGLGPGPTADINWTALKQHTFLPPPHCASWSHHAWPPRRLLPEINDWMFIVPAASWLLDEIVIWYICYPVPVLELTVLNLNSVLYSLVETGRPSLRNVENTSLMTTYKKY